MLLNLAVSDKNRCRILEAGGCSLLADVVEAHSSCDEAKKSLFRLRCHQFSMIFMLLSAREVVD